jgi:hypothetical protein
VRLAGAFLLAIAIFGASAQTRVSRASIRHMEQSVDSKVAAIDQDEPGFLLGPTRGVYLDGYGVVFTAEVDLLPSAAPNPFRPAYSKQDILRLKGKKQARISLLKQKMRDTIIAAAGPLDNVPPDERIALAVTIPYFGWEDGAGLPRQIVMYAPRSLLLKGAKGDTLAVDNGLKVQEF